MKKAKRKLREDKIARVNMKHISRYFYMKIHIKFT